MREKGFTAICVDEIKINSVRAMWRFLALRWDRRIFLRLVCLLFGCSDVGRFWKRCCRSDQFGRENTQVNLVGIVLLFRYFMLLPFSSLFLLYPDPFAVS